MTKTPATLAKQMERAMHRAGKDCFHYENEHCALFESDLGYICPRNHQDRKKKLTEFAAQYGFRLRFYRQGLFAIFGKRAPPVANDAGAFSAPRQFPLLSQELQAKSAVSRHNQESQAGRVSACAPISGFLELAQRQATNAAGFASDG